MKNILKYALCLFTCAISVTSENAVELAFKEEAIVPDALFISPKAPIYIRYPSGATVELGNELSQTQTAQQPFVLWDEDPKAFYTLVLIDLDDPSREDPTYRSLLYWLVGNIPGRDINMGQTLAMYHSPNPRKWTGPHRFVFLVFKQHGKIRFRDHWSEKQKHKRRSFGLLGFCDRYNLNTPAAGNFFILYHDLETFRKPYQSATYELRWHSMY